MIDPDDLIFPRAATRVGPKYQAQIPLAIGEPIPTIPGLPPPTPAYLGETVN